MGSKLVSGLLGLSALLGIVILAEDALRGAEGERYLWATASVAAPVPHAYALVAFVVIEVVLAILVLANPKLGVTVAIGWSILWLLAMLLDPLTYVYYKDLPGAAAFAEYLYGIWGFDLLLIVQVVTIVAGLRTRKQSSTSK